MEEVLRLRADKESLWKEAPRAAVPAGKGPCAQTAWQSEAPRFLRVWPLLPHHTAPGFVSRLSFHERLRCFLLKAEQSVLPSFTSPIHQVLYLSPPLPASRENLHQSHWWWEQPPDGRASLKPGLWRATHRKTDTALSMSNVSEKDFFYECQGFWTFHVQQRSAKTSEYHEMLRPVCSGAADNAASPTDATPEPSPLIFSRIKCFILLLHTQQTLPSTGNNKFQHRFIPPYSKI